MGHPGTGVGRDERFGRSADSIQQLQAASLLPWIILTKPGTKSQIGQLLGGKAYLPQLPEGVKDANEWLSVHHATADEAHGMLNRAQSWLMSEVERVSHLEGLEQEDAIRDLFQHAHDLNVLSLARSRQ